MSARRQRHPLDRLVRLGALLLAALPLAAGLGTPGRAVAATATAQSSASGHPGRAAPPADPEHAAPRVHAGRAAPAADPEHAAPPAHAGRAAPGGHVVLVGVDGLEWRDVSASTMPTLFTLSSQGSMASLLTRSAEPTTCPADGWLTLGSGSRASGGRTGLVPPGADPLITVPTRACAPLPATPPGRGRYVIPGYASLVRLNATLGNTHSFGALATAMARTGGCVAASGAGAMLAAADPAGRVQDYLGAVPELDAADLAVCPLTLVDVPGYLDYRPSTDQPYPPRVSRSAVFTQVDAELATLLTKLPADSTFVLAGLDDSDLAACALHVLLVTGTAADGSAFTPGHWLTSTTTRIQGLVQTTDLTPSLLHWAGLSDHQIAQVTVGAPTPPDAAGGIPAAVRSNTANEVFERSNGAFLTWLSHALLLLLVTACVIVGAASGLAGLRRLLLAALAAWATLLAAAVPAAFLAGLDDWPAAGADGPAVRLYGLTAVLAIALTGCVLGLWRISLLSDLPLAPAGLIGLLTFAVVGIDAMSGSHLQRQTPFGLLTLAGTRFSGIGEAALGVYAVAAMIATAFAVSRCSRRTGLAVIGVLGASATLACAVPVWGGNLAGALALVPCFGLLALGVLRRTRDGAAGEGATSVTGALIAVGVFAAYLTHGPSHEVGLGLYVPCVLLLGTAVLAWPRQIGAHTIADACAREPVMRDALLAALFACTLCWLTADPGSGLAVPRAALYLAVPLGIASCALALRTLPETAGDSVPGPVPFRMDDQRGGAHEA